MKKAFLVLFTFIPLIASCNKKGSFVNPFPDDKYQKIGFTFSDDEKINRQLTVDEKNIVANTINKSDTYDGKIYSMTSTIQTRDYTRAFSGEFKQGYSVSNVMKYEQINLYRQDQDGSNKYRTKKETNAETTSNYSYGDVNETISQDDYYYFNKTGSETKQEADSRLASLSLNLRTKRTVNSYETIKDSGPIVSKASADPEKEYTSEELASINEYLLIKQSTYITTPDSKSGVDKNGNIILVKATQTKHVDTETKKEGIFSLKDGRSYQAMDNSLTVTKLKIIDKTWCLVDYVRVYSETVITSDVIQPNVQVEKLSEPITVSYTESISKYSTEQKAITGDLPGEGKEQ